MVGAGGTEPDTEERDAGWYSMIGAKKESGRQTAKLWLVAASGALGGLLFGYDWVVIGGAKPFYELFFHLDRPAQQGWAMSCALIGCLIGSLAAGWLTERYGRKRPLVLAAAVFAVSSLGTACAAGFALFVLWRILGGVAIGMASNVSPLYIAEIAPAHLRGRLVSLNQMTIVFGILLAQIVNWRIAHPVPIGATAAEILLSWNGQFGWRWMFAATAIPSTVFFVAACLLPESPRWLALKARPAAARRVLDLFNSAEETERVLAEMTTVSHGAPIGGLRACLARQGVRRALFLGIALAVLQQWSGTNVIFNYAQEIFAAAGYQVSGILFNIVITGIVNVLFTFVALATIDRFGRRALLSIGAIALAADYATLAALYHYHLQGWPMLVLVLAAIALYAMSLAPATWVVIAEIFPRQMRGEAISICTTALWIACFLLTYTFPILNRSLGPQGTFGLYAGICAAGFALVRFLLPETKGKSLEAIESEVFSTHHL